MKKKLRETLLDLLIRQPEKEPVPERVVGNPPVVELELKALKSKIPKTIQEYDQELLEDELGVVEKIGKHE